MVAALEALLNCTSFSGVGSELMNAPLNFGTLLNLDNHLRVGCSGGNAEWGVKGTFVHPILTLQGGNLRQRTLPNILLGRCLLIVYMLLNNCSGVLPN